MDLLLKLISTAAAGALDVWVGIITGVALGALPRLERRRQRSERDRGGNARGGGRRAAAN
ncbi:MAG: hypothetical protein M3Q49_13355 [Actinomycetota bacterium]|nr:hypothetical protein [Actinomycetota bacterium]